MTTSTADNLPRGGRGKFRRQLVNVERDAEAARLAARGVSYSEIAERLGYSDKGDAWRGSRRALAELAQAHGADELRQQMIASNTELRAKMWAILDAPPPLTDRVGRVVHDDDDQVVPDTQAVIAAAQTLLKAEERLARLVGADAPRKSVTLSVSQSLEQVREVYIQEKGFDPFAPETRDAVQGWLAGEGRLMLGGRLIAPALGELEPEEREDVLDRIREVAAAGIGQEHVIAGRVVSSRDT